MEITYDMQMGSLNDSGVTGGQRETLKTTLWVNVFECPMNDFKQQFLEFGDVLLL
jgi:hypothetical protein